MLVTENFAYMTTDIKITPFLLQTYNHADVDQSFKQFYFLIHLKKASSAFLSLLKTGYHTLLVGSLILLTFLSKQLQI